MKEKKFKKRSATIFNWFKNLYLYAIAYEIVNRIFLIHFKQLLKLIPKRGHILVFYVVESDHSHKGIVTDWGTKLNLHFLQKWYLISMKSQFFP